MQESTFIFGPLLVERRKEAGLTQWALALKTSVNVTNLRKIEKGKTQPGVMLALKLVSAIGTDVGNFFEDLAVRKGFVVQSGGVRGCENQKQSVFMPDDLIEAVRGVRCPFGPCLKRVRVGLKVSQKRIAEYANYQLRNILVVENGAQEPGVQTALALVCGTGCDVGAFFRGLKDIAERIACENAL